ncbi:hypothetical protein E4U41_001392 [Claviceps citrina]|nr:hypothetical protein E4U41_001392 [Claviceps citrina]
MIWSALTTAALLALSAAPPTPVLAHPETEHARRAQSAALRRIAAHSGRSLAACAGSPAAVALRRRAVARRAAWADELRARGGLLRTHHVRRGKQELEKWMSVPHDQTARGYNLDTPVDDIFASNVSCILVPETRIGPYYVAGEFLRGDISEAQPGVASHLDFQFIDMHTCEAVPGLLVDVWHANAVGVYSGVTAEGQAGLGTNFCRGVQTTDGDGVVQYSTVFPGHYTGRTNHFHVMSTANATVLSNGTHEGGTVSHIGQVYFEQALIAAVEATAPYWSNEQPVTDNRQDFLTGDEASEEYDPFMKYVYLGHRPEDGLLLWITIGIDTAANYSRNISTAAHWHPGGGTDERRPRHT